MVPTAITFVFNLVSGNDVIYDFDQGNLAVGSGPTERDVINVQAYGFADWTALHAVISDIAVFETASRGLAHQFPRADFRSFDWRSRSLSPRNCPTQIYQAQSRKSFRPMVFRGQSYFSRLRCVLVPATNRYCFPTALCKSCLRFSTMSPPKGAVGRNHPCYFPF